MAVVTIVRGRERSGPHIFIAIPCHGEISAPTFTAFFEGAQMLDAADYNITLCTEAGNCHVDDARNSLVREFLKTDCTDLVFIDADVGFRCQDLLKLVTVDRDVVAGVYPKKEDEESFPVLPIGGEIWADSDGLVEVEGVPTGFLRIKRHVLERLSEAATGFIGQAGDPVPYKVIFERIVSGEQRRSGDYAFCWKWRQAGGKIYVDPEMRLSHTGAKAWLGCLGDYWKREHGVEAAYLSKGFDEAVAALKAGNPSPEHFVALFHGWDNEWAAPPDLLLYLYRAAHGDILECGSGLSTLVLATRGKVTALEHDPIFASHLRAILDRYGLGAEIVCKPLKDGWYDFAGGDYDTLLIDGPPRKLGDRSVALGRVSAPLIIWDDYTEGLESPEIINERFAVWRAARQEAA